jgi:hypothetical protein
MIESVLFEKGTFDFYNIVKKMFYSILAAFNIILDCEL